MRGSLQRNHPRMMIRPKLAETDCDRHCPFTPFTFLLSHFLPVTVATAAVTFHIPTFYFLPRHASRRFTIP
jgi:hypothetical protein